MDIGLLVKLSLGLVVTALGAWLIAVLLGLSANSVEAVIVLRTLLTLPVVLLMTRVLVRRAYDSPRLLRTIVAAALVSYALWLPAWGGHGLIGQLLVDHSGAAYVVDLIIWVGAVLVAARSVEARPSRRHLQPYQAA
ncbi:hypothetical protein [Nocardioides gilvus]|uniref:hypothetical protein n=1 Tax=Nocardioides gilvus TaxID=1735589 RepID=UPI000D74C486|nr:hypothetical protein [Nocardioides gilvus]